MLDMDVAMRVIREQRYLSLKGAKWKHGKSLRSLDSYVRRNYLASAVSFCFFSIVLSIIRYLETPSVLGFAEAEVILFFYLLMTNVYNAVFFLSQVRSSSIVEPVLHLPGISISRVLTLATLYYYGTATLFVVVPSFVIFSILYSNYLSLLVLIFWSFLYIILGFTFGVLTIYAVSRRSDSKHSGKVRMIGGAIRILGIVLAFVVFELWIYDPSLISPAVFARPGILSALIPVINVSVTSMQPFSNGNQIYLPFSAALYTAITIILFRNSSWMLEKAYTASLPQTSRSYRDTSTRMRRGKYDKMIRKDLSILFRSPQNSVLIFLPLMLSLPALIPVILAKPDSALAVYYLALSLPVMSASFYPLVTLVSEGKAISLLFSLPIKKSDFLLSKIFVSGMIFLVVSASIILFAGLYIGENLLLIAFTVFSILAGYTYTSVYNFIRMSRKITDQVTILNLDSFGGTFGIMMIFAVTMVLLLLPIFSGSLVAYFRFGNLSNDSFILGMDTILNALMLIATSLLALRSLRGTSVASYSV